MLEPWMSRFPKKLWIGTFEITVLFVPREHEKLTDAEGENDGCTDLSPAQIHICDSLSLTILMETVIHEATHFIDFVSGIEDGVAEEDIADKHGKFWTQLWLDNPKFQRWWTSACNAVREERTGKRKR